MELSGIDEAVRLAQERWPQLEPRIKTRAEACSPCPYCGGDDRFILFDTGFWFCRPGPGHCGRSGWLDDDKPRKLTPAEVAEIRLRRLEQKQIEQEQRLTALEQLNASQVHVRYHQNLDEQTFDWWLNKGAEPTTIFDYQLGFCRHCPTDREHGPSYTIPLWDYEHRTLWNIRHRLSNATNGDKYRPEMAGLGTCLAFPHHLADAEYGVIVEGSIKAMIVHQNGFPAVGVLGKRGRFKGEWLKWFPDSIYIALDPDAAESADRLGHGIAETGKTVFVAEFPIKPDDLFIDGGTTADFEQYLRWARRVD